MPDYQDFARVVDLIGQLERQDALDIVYESPPVGERLGKLVLRIAPEARELPAVNELITLLGRTSREGGDHAFRDGRTL